LLVLETSGRLTAEEAITHPWLIQTTALGSLDPTALLIPANPPPESEQDAGTPVSTPRGGVAGLLTGEVWREKGELSFLEKEMENLLMSRTTKVEEVKDK
jgi:hypothetical protein